MLDIDSFDFPIQLYAKDFNYISEAITIVFYKVKKLEVLCKQFKIETILNF